MEQEGFPPTDYIDKSKEYKKICTKWGEKPKEKNYQDKFSNH
jgi:hypothetical protein